MLVLIALVLIGLGLAIAPRLIVFVFALMIGVILIRRSRQVQRALLRSSSDHRTRQDFDSRPSQSDRRLMRAHLKLAIRQTELASLFPGVMQQARSQVDH